MRRDEETGRDEQIDRLVAAIGTDRPAEVASAISLVENGHPGFERFLTAIHPRLGRAHRIGITGPPGAGKSTLTQALVHRLRSEGRTVGVVAVDPTSPLSGGALLGDRIRMEGVSLDPGVFIRSMATRGAVGGLAVTTREVCDVLDVAGYERILVETVGAGQAELEVVAVTDTTVLVLVPESGDGIQALKAGLMEVASVYVVNKADRPQAERLVRDIQVTQAIRRGISYGRMGGEAEGRAEAEWTPPVLATVATTGVGVPGLGDAIERHREWLVASGQLETRRRLRLAGQTRDVVERALRHWAHGAVLGDRIVERRAADVEAGRLTPYDVAEEIRRLLPDHGE